MGTEAEDDAPAAGEAAPGGGGDRGSGPRVARGVRGSGPRIAWAFHAALAACSLVAFVSLAVQVEVLIGSRGLLPVAPFVASLAARGDVGWADFPSLAWLASSDAALRGGALAGALLSALALLGVAPRLVWALLVPLYLSFAVACRSFLGFQWDNLLLEAGLLAVLLPRDRRAPLVHLLFRVLLFKLYFESGLAKWQSHLMDWHDGSAMTFYYETAPLPAWPAWHLHHLPAAFHHVESWLAVGFELFATPLVFGPRPARLLAFATFTAFQAVNLATANYGFFVYLALALHLFLLDDRDLVRARRLLAGPWRAVAARLPADPSLETMLQRTARRVARLRRRLRAHRRAARVRALAAVRFAAWRRPAAALVAVPFAAAWLGLTVRDGAERFTSPPEACEQLRPRACLPRPAALQAALDATAPASQAAAPFRLVNVYHLFGHITRERIEPEVQTLAGGAWTAHPLRYKPGPVDRPPPFVAPHQPRVDFLLWFYGLSFRRGMPAYVGTLLDRLCHDPDAVQGLFPGPLPAAPEAVRLVFWRYRFTTPEARERTGAWWTREEVAALAPRRCAP